MTLDLPAVSVHSVAEAYLYIKTLYCPHCGRGPVRERGQITKGPSEQNGWTLAAACGACGGDCVVRFEIQPAPTRQQAQSDEINPTKERSKAIDLLGWLSLCQSIIAASEKEVDRQAARQLAYEAGQCLDEAMKFYERDNDMPPVDAFFTHESLTRFREHPEQFSRSKWRQRRLVLPDAKVRTRSSDGVRWWQFWRRGR